MLSVDTQSGCFCLLPAPALGPVNETQGKPARPGVLTEPQAVWKFEGSLDFTERGMLMFQGSSWLCPG